MKKIVVFLSFLIFSWLGEASTGVEYTQLEEKDGTVYYRGEKYTGKVSRGKDCYYYENGKANGTWLWFYPNGNLKTIETWKEGKLQGKYILYLENGNPVMKTSYWKGKDMGEYLLYYPNGMLRVKGRYEYGKPIGVWEYYTETGKLKAKGKEVL